MTLKPYYIVVAGTKATDYSDKETAVKKALAAKEKGKEVEITKGTPTAEGKKRHDIAQKMVEAGVPLSEIKNQVKVGGYYKLTSVRLPKVKAPKMVAPHRCKRGGGMTRRSNR